jgi:hypothetical protein
LPCSRKFAERSATEGSSIVGPAMEPIWIQSRARLRSARARARCRPGLTWRSCRPSFDEIGNGGIAVTARPVHLADVETVWAAPEVPGVRIVLVP